MSVIQPPPPRCTIENTSPSLIITIPGRKHWFVIVYMVLLLVVWIMVAIPVCGMLLAGAGVSLVSLLGGFANTQADSIVGVMGFCGMGLALIAFLGIMLVGALYVLYLFLWQLTGVERIEVDAQGITVQRLMLKTLRVGRPKIHAAEHIKDLRTVPSSTPVWWRGMYMWWSFMDGSIAFDYGAKTFRYGSGVDEAEAKDIIKAIHERFPQYQTK